MRARLQRRNGCSKDFSLIFKRIATENTLNNINAFAHDRGRADFFAFTLTDFFHEDLGGAEAQKKAVAGKILHDARFHRDLHRMARVRRDDAPAKLDPARLRGDDGKNGRRRASFKAVLAPPGIGFGDPECIKASILAGFGHGDGFVDRLHTELQYTDIKRSGHFAF